MHTLYYRHLVTFASTVTQRSRESDADADGQRLDDSRRFYKILTRGQLQNLLKWYHIAMLRHAAVATLALILYNDFYGDPMIHDDDVFQPSLARPRGR